MVKTNNEHGRAYTVIIGGYAIAKGVLNMILGGGFGGIIVGIFILAVLYTGLQYMNYLTAAFMAITAIGYLPGNIAHISDNWIYLIEGLIDIAFAVMLCLNADVKEHFTNKWVELDDLIQK